jgi:membrane-bound lytic murein transglycosylase D
MHHKACLHRTIGWSWAKGSVFALVCACFLLGAAEPEDASSVVDDTALDAPEADEEIEASHALPEGVLDLTAEEDHWLLLDTLKSGFAQTESLEHAVSEAYERTYQPVLSSWQEVSYYRWVLYYLHRTLELPHTEVTGLQFDIPMVSHPLVDVYVEYFSGRGRWFFENWLSRAARYMPIMLPILKEHGLPQDIIYLAMIESGFVAKAMSTASASGFWQFIRSTGTLYGLKSDAWVDERRDFIKATHAACNYLKQLYEQFGDWHLAWASYNAGDGRIRRALAKYGVSTFWDLVDYRNSLAKETKHYVPKILAAAIVSKSRVEYGFKNIVGESPLEYDETHVDDAVDLRSLAEKIQVDPEHMRVLNPMYIHQMTPPKHKSLVRVPKGRVSQALAAIETLPVVERVTYMQHPVRRGDSLSSVAQRYGVSVNALKSANKLSSLRRVRVGRRILIPVYHNVRGALQSNVGSEPPPVVDVGGGSSSKKQASSRRDVVRARHVVSPGDTLWSIARRYGVTVQKLKQWNGKKTKRLRVGDVLSVVR